MRTALVPALLLNLCGTSGGQVGQDVGEPYAGPGWSVRLPPQGGTVKVEAERIAVDAADFSRFWDVRWDLVYPDLGLPVKNLALTECDPAVWDDPVVTETTWTASALCTRREKFEWMIGRVEKHGDRALVFFYVANRDFLAYEDAWVDFANTAGTLSARPTPPEPLDDKALRAKIRAGAKNVGPSLSPLPGGRVMTKAVVPVLTEVWERRASLPPPPARFDGTTPPPEPAADTDAKAQDTDAKAQDTDAEAKDTDPAE